MPYWKRLVGFARAPVKAGETRVVRVPLLWDDVAVHNAQMQFALTSGSYKITAGGSSLDTPLAQEVELRAGGV